MNGRTQFTFYRSIHESIKRIRKKTDRADAYTAICDYALDGIEPDLDSISDAAAIVFLSAKPNLDASKKKASAGKQGGSKPKANGKQTESKTKQGASEKENEKEGEKEIEDECLEGSGAASDNPAFAAVVSAYMDKINPTPSPMSIDELKAYTEQMGAECCLRAFDIALDAKKAHWPYIRAILRDKMAKGVRCLADWDEVEQRRETSRDARPADQQRRRTFSELIEEAGT